MVDGEDFDLYVCGKDTPIPTAEEIVERREMHEACKTFPVIEITKEEFLKLHNELLDSILDSSDEEVELYAPNTICEKTNTWEFWFNDEDIIYYF